MDTRSIDTLVEEKYSVYNDGASLDSIREELRADGQKEELVRYVATRILDKSIEDETKEHPFSASFNKAIAIGLIVFGLAMGYYLLTFSENWLVISTVPLLLILAGTRQFSRS